MIMMADVCICVDFEILFKCIHSLQKVNALLRGSSGQVSHAVYPASVPCRNQPICKCWKAWWSYEPGRGERWTMDELLTAQGGQVVRLSLSTTGERPAQVSGSFHNPWLHPYMRGRKPQQEKHSAGAILLQKYAPRGGKSALLFAFTFILRR